MSQHGLGRQNSASFQKMGSAVHCLECCLHTRWFQDLICGLWFCVATGKLSANAPTTRSPTGATSHRDLLQTPRMSIFKRCCACAVSRRTKSTRRCRRWCCGCCPRPRHSGMDTLWCGWMHFGVTLSLAAPAQGLRGGMVGAVRAAVSKKDLERAELPWLRARPGWCVRGRLPPTKLGVVALNSSRTGKWLLASLGKL